MALEAEEGRFHAAAAQAGIHYAESRHFRDLWNGLSIQANTADAGKIGDLPGVAAVYPIVEAVRAQQEGGPDNVSEMVTALKMTGADIAQNELGLSGRRVRVAVMDSGIDYDHPDLGGCFGSGCRVAKGWDFVGDAFNPDTTSAAYHPTPTPDPLPDDCDGHGTHVAGIIGANGTIKGVAPQATLYAYRVFGCVGPTTTDIMLAAMERAYADGADILNMSIGAPYQWPQYPTAKAASRLVRKGMVVVAAAGNEGANGLYAAAAPSIGRDVISVASFDNTFANLASFTVSPDNRRVGFTTATGGAPAPTSGTGTLARTGTATSTTDACAALPAGSLAGQIALVRRGTCGFAIKAAVVQTAGAVGAVFYNNAPGRISISVVGAVPITIPVVSITAADGEALDARIAAGTVTLTWTAGTISEPQATANLISSFSSYGPAADLTIKPDLGAPGGSIRSTLPLELGGFGNLSGTSMASPYVAGAIALLLEARPRTSPAEVLTLLQNNGKPHLWSGNPTLGVLDLVHRQGAGMLTIDQAILAEAKVTPSRLALGDFDSPTPVARRLHVESIDRHHRGWHHHGSRWHDDDTCTAVTYTLGHEPAPATGPSTFTPSLLAAYATVTFSEPTVSVGHSSDWWLGWFLGVRGDDNDISVLIAPPASAGARLFGGYITLTPDDDGPVLRVPYMGYNGDYQLITALTPTAAGFPWLAKLNGTSLVNQPGGASFTMTGTDTPFLLFHIDHQVTRLRAKVIDAATGDTVGYADDERFVGRNSTATAFFAIMWDGTASGRPSQAAEPVPNGAYKIELSILKALGDPRNPDHTEVWTSPTITIARP